MFLGERVKRLDSWDVGLIKLGTMAFVLFLITIWTGLRELVDSVNPWVYFVAFVILAGRPFYRVYLKK